MNILILNPIGRLSNGHHVCLFPSRWDAAAPFPMHHYYPYQLAYLSSLLKRDLKKAHVKMFDPNVEDLDWLETVTYSLNKSYLPIDVLVTECSALTYPDMTKVMMGLRRTQEHAMRNHPMKAFLTGPYGSANEAKALSDGWDMVFHGEYERDILWELQGWTRTNADLGDGRLHYRTVANALEPAWSTKKPYIDLDWLPWPEDEDISRINYHECSNPFSGMVQLYATRGCPLACSFCVVPSYYGGHGQSYLSHRVRDCSDICDEISYLARKYDGRFSGCFFNEETHNANPEWLRRFAEALIEHGLNRFHFDAMCGYWNWDEDLLRLLRQAGYCQLRIGIESLSSSVGKRIHKTIHEEKLMQFLSWCKKYEIAVYGTTQVGAPGSTYDSDIETLEAMWNLRRDGLIRTWQNSVSTPQPGTPMYVEAKAENRLLTEDITQYNGCQAVMDWPNYPAWQINQAKALFNQNVPHVEMVSA